MQVAPITSSYVRNKKPEKQPSFKASLSGQKLFQSVAASECNPNWSTLVNRLDPLYERGMQIRSDFMRDYGRVIFSNPFKGLAGKTQVFAHPDDSVSTRMLHSEYVAANAETLSDFWGLNSQLARVGGKAHDLGHSPFGHDGEVALDRLMQKYKIQSDFWQGHFWHEKNGLRVVDDIATLPNPQGYEENLNLTYAVRDSIVSHCGEVDQSGIVPRNELLNLSEMPFENRPQPYTWEGCCTKICDRTAYVGVDIEDAIRKGTPPSSRKELAQRIEDATGVRLAEVNNTVLMNHFLTDLIQNSSPSEGIRFSRQTAELMNTAKKFNHDTIYAPAKERQAQYIDLVINTLFEHLDGFFDSSKTLQRLGKQQDKQPKLAQSFREWLIKYSDADIDEREKRKYANKVLYSMHNQNDYRLAIIEYIAGMTDDFARAAYEEITFV